MHLQMETMQNLNDIKDETIESLLREKDRMRRELKHSVQANKQMQGMKNDFIIFKKI